MWHDFDIDMLPLIKEELNRAVQVFDMAIEISHAKIGLLITAVGVRIAREQAVHRG